MVNEHAFMSLVYHLVQISAVISFETQQNIVVPYRFSFFIMHVFIFGNLGFKEKSNFLHINYLDLKNIVP